MSNLLMFGLISYGITSIIVWGSIFDWFRALLSKWSEVKNITHYIGLFLKKLTSCVLCTSTWVGFFLGLFVTSPVKLSFDGLLIDWFYWFFDGMLSAGFVWSFNAIIETYENNSK